MAEPKIAHCFFCSHIPPADLSNKDKWREVATHILKYNKKLPKRTKVWIAHVLAERKARIELKPIAKDPSYEPTELGEENRANAKLQLSGKTHDVTCLCPKCKRQHLEKLEIEFLRLPHLWIIENKPAVLCGNCKR